MLATPKSEYVKSKIKGMKFSDKNFSYISNLIYFESCVLDKSVDKIGELLMWTRMYEKDRAGDMLAIVKELKPDIDIAGLKKAEKRAEIKYQKERQEDLKLFRKDDNRMKKRWVALGGQL